MKVAKISAVLIWVILIMTYVTSFILLKNSFSEPTTNYAFKFIVALLITLLCIIVGMIINATTETLESKSLMRFFEKL